MLVYRAPLNLEKLWDEQEQSKKNFVCSEVRTRRPCLRLLLTWSQMKRIFADTRLARCEGDWATKALVVQFLAGHRKRINQLKKGLAQQLEKIGDEDAMELLYYQECGIAPPNTLAFVNTGEGDWAMGEGDNFGGGDGEIGGNDDEFGGGDNNGGDDVY
jgi:hypothetical protein